MPTQHNSPTCTGHRPNADAATVGTLRAAGALILGKTDTMEFASTGRLAPTRYGGIDILVNNAGISSSSVGDPDGLEG